MATTDDTLNEVTRVPAASPATALAHFEARLAVETDCWDVHDALARARPGFVLLDVRSAALYARGHLPRAVSLPHAEITAERLAAWPADALFVVYCAGPHCNGANKAAVRIARLGRAVKEMLGGFAGWRGEGYPLEHG